MRYGQLLIKDYALRPTTLLTLFCASVLAGLGAARWQLAVPVWFGLVAAGVCLLLRRQTVLCMTWIVIAGLSLGVWRGASMLQRGVPYSILSGQKVSLRAVAQSDAIYAEKGQLSFAIENIQVEQPIKAALPGKMKVKGYGELAVFKGDVLLIEGKMYKTRGGMQASTSYAQIQRVDSHNAFIDTVRRKFAAGVQTALPEPAASFGLGLLVGQRNTLPFQTSQALLMVGLVHIVAVSGYNLTIILDAVRRLLGSRSKLLCVAVAAILMIGFLFLTGMSASIVRASVVSGLSLIAWYYGRTIRPILLILLAAAGTAYVNPLYLWSDVGWYLSFLAFFGILMIAPQILSKLYKNREVPLVLKMAVETMAAELMTLPLILYIFGQMSLIGLVANIVVALFVPIAMLFTLAAGLAGMYLPMLSGVFAYPAKIMLTYMLDMATLLSRVPNIFQTGVYISLTDMLLCYGVIGSIVYLLYKRPKKWFADI